jgi:hypothetical protein
MRSPQKDYWIRALQREMNNFTASRTMREIPLQEAIASGRTIIPYRLVFALKGLDSDTHVEEGQFKLRCTAKGFKQKRSEYGDTFAPTPGLAASRLIVATSLQNGWVPETADVTAAFLQPSFKPEHRALMQPPPGCATPGTVWELMKPVYGLKSSANYWSKDVHRFCTGERLMFENKRFKRAHFDPCVYLHYDKRNALDGIVHVHVDDFTISGTDTMKAHVKAALQKQWTVTLPGIMKRHLGVNYNWLPGRVEMDQVEMIDTLLELCGMQDCRGASTPAVEKRLSKPTHPATAQEEQYIATKPYRSAVGILLWLTRQTRPDIAHATNQVSQFVDSPRKEHWDAILHACRYL